MIERALAAREELELQCELAYLRRDSSDEKCSDDSRYAVRAEGLEAAKTPDDAQASTHEETNARDERGRDRALHVERLSTAIADAVRAGDLSRALVLVEELRATATEATEATKGPVLRVVR
jgi:hypothetical protein